MSSGLPDGRKMWIRAFYGFNPEEAGYVGWTEESGQRRALRELKDGDLMLIYGASSSKTEKAMRAHVMGFVEIEARPIRDVEKSSKAALAAKAAEGFGDKWVYGLPIRRAWRALDKLPIARVAPETYDKKAAQGIGVWGKELTEDEIALALRIKVEEINVFGEPPIPAPNGQPQKLAKVFEPSRAFPGATGERTAQYEDGDTYLYLAQFDGDGHTLIGRPKSLGDKSVALKIGVTNAPKRRCEELNAGIPPAAHGRWRIVLLSQPYPRRRDAEQAESEFKAEASKKLESLGKEFFWGKMTESESIWISIPGTSRF